MAGFDLLALIVVFCVTDNATGRHFRLSQLMTALLESYIVCGSSKNRSERKKYRLAKTVAIDCSRLADIAEWTT